MSLSCFTFCESATRGTLHFQNSRGQGTLYGSFDGEGKKRAEKGWRREEWNDKDDANRWSSSKADDESPTIRSLTRRGSSALPRRFSLLPCFSYLTRSLACARPCSTFRLLLCLRLTSLNLDRSTFSLFSSLSAVRLL